MNSVELYDALNKATHDYYKAREEAFGKWETSRAAKKLYSRMLEAKKAVNHHRHDSLRAQGCSVRSGGLVPPVPAAGA